MKFLRMQTKIDIFSTCLLYLLKKSAIFQQPLCVNPFTSRENEVIVLAAWGRCALLSVWHTLTLYTSSTANVSRELSVVCWPTPPCYMVTKQCFCKHCPSGKCTLPQYNSQKVVVHQRLDVLF